MPTRHPIRFVLFETTHPGNIGSVARAMKTMGYSDLYLVNPPDEFLCADSRAMASGAQDVLRGARVVGSLEAALDGCGRVLGASARHRRIGCPELDPREAAAELLASADSRPAALVFGPERSGLANEQLDLCNAIVYIPANPEYSSLNLAQAVQVLAYELRQADRLERSVPPPESPPAGPAQLELFYAHLERALLASGFLNPANPRHLMRRLRRLFNRARLDQNELNIMRGILSSLAPGSGDNPP
jgi:tRNA/rRNA methyltransferase/tRNA (cytidine32/uridine32-2'-O)-methyltransferase